MKRGRIGTRIVAGALTLSLAAGLAGAAPARALDSWFSQPSGWATAAGCWTPP